MHDTGFSSRCHRQAAFLHDLQHRRILGQDFRDQRAQAAIAGEGCNMPHQDRCRALAPGRGRSPQRPLRPRPGSELDVSCAADDRLLSVRRRFRQRSRHDPRNSTFRKKSNLAFGEFAPRAEEAAEQRLRAGSIDRGQHGVAVVRPRIARIRIGASVAQRFGSRKNARRALSWSITRFRPLPNPSLAGRLQACPALQLAFELSTAPGCRRTSSPASRSPPMRSRYRSPMRRSPACRRRSASTAICSAGSAMRCSARRASSRSGRPRRSR